eukprot:Rhum_TRINITY_DN14549_c4_g1::Rhum_TRINITY_DN14549_c4_g1_i1::g.98769::m.98769
MSMSAAVESSSVPSPPPSSPPTAAATATATAAAPEGVRDGGRDGEQQRHGTLAQHSLRARHRDGEAAVGHHVAGVGGVRAHDPRRRQREQVRRVGASAGVRLGVRRGGGEAVVRGHRRQRQLRAQRHRDGGTFDDADRDVGVGAHVQRGQPHVAEAHRHVLDVHRRTCGAAGRLRHLVLHDNLAQVRDEGTPLAVAVDGLVGQEDKRVEHQDAVLQGHQRPHVVSHLRRLRRPRRRRLRLAFRAQDLLLVLLRPQQEACAVREGQRTHRQRQLGGVCHEHGRAAADALHVRAARLEVDDALPGCARVLLRAAASEVPERRLDEVEIFRRRLRRERRCTGVGVLKLE